jgi:peptidoglycan/LPS O-acetylase OafA/YrhL
MEHLPAKERPGAASGRKASSILGTQTSQSTLRTVRTARTLSTSTLATPGTLGTIGTVGALEYRPQLDGLRAVAVAAVAWSHWERPYQFGIPFGTGVHLFYVLSGFLITGILLSVRERADRTEGLKSFYIRRALRIFPAFYLTLALAWAADIPPVRDTFWWHALYVSNVQIVMSGEWPGAASHFWSLAVEEQFYLAWPWLIVFAPRRWLGPAILAAIGCGPVFRYWLATLDYRETLLGVLTPGSLDSLGVGAWLALAARDHSSGPAMAASHDPWSAFRRFSLVAGAGWVGLLIWERLATPQSLPLPLLSVKQTLQAMVFGWIVLNASIGFRGITGRILSAQPVVYFGRISYGVYLAHGFAGAMLAAIGLSSHSMPEPWRFIALATVTVAVAAASWRFYEAPINRLKAKFR